MPRGYVPNDRYARKAKEEGYRARSVFKLQELDLRFKLFKPAMTVLDVGAAPGSWLQYAAKRVGERGKVIGLDLKKIEAVADNIKTFEIDFTDLDAVRNILSDNDIKKLDLIIADAAPNTSGVRDVDQYRSVELNEHVIELSKEFLRHGGNCIMKILRGADFDPFLAQVKPLFNRVKIVTAEATRKSSREVYMVCLKKK